MPLYFKCLDYLLELQIYNYLAKLLSRHTIQDIFKSCI